MPKYAVILPIPGAGAPGKVLSIHYSQRAARAEKPWLDDAYIAKRKRDGEWETPQEARDREATTRHGGGKRVLVGGKRRNVYLDDPVSEFAIHHLGGGELSAGLRAAVLECMERRGFAGRAGAKQEEG